MFETTEVTKEEKKLNNFETLKNNKIIKKLCEEDLEKVEKYFEENFPIYYVLKENWEDEYNVELLDADECYVSINPNCKKDIFDGKIDTIKNLSEQNFNFLNHMFRFNKTLKEFSEILDKGKYKVTQQYDFNEIWNYFKANHYSYTEKRGKYIGSMETKSKLDYFPTNYEIQYLSFLAIFSIRGIEIRKKSTERFLNKYTSFGSSGKLNKNIYVELVKMGRFDLINELFKFNIDPVINNYENTKLVVADLFAGEGEWLGNIKSLINNKQTYILANEIEENRMLACRKKKFTNTIYGSYEELGEKIPKKFIDILLFNPPYGETDGERNVVRFLKMLEKDQFLKAESTVVLVINKNDLEAATSLILKMFTNYRVFNFENGNEAERLKQVCIVCNYEYTDYRYKLASRVNQLENAINNKTFKFIDQCWFDSNYIYAETKNITEQFDRFKLSLNPEKYQSDLEDECWKNVINNCTIETFQGKTIKLAEKPRNLGAAANFISSGLINGEIEGEHNHCIAAGISTKTEKIFDEETNQIFVTKSSQPFLSVLTGGRIVDITNDVNNTNVNIMDDGSVAVI